MWMNSGQPADSYYEVRPEYTDDVPKTRFKIKVGKTLSVRRWQAAFSSEGYLDIGPTLTRIRRGDIAEKVCQRVGEEGLKPISQPLHVFHSSCLRKLLPISILEGIHPSIRGEVWEFLLGCFSPNCTFEEREQLRQQRRVKYAQWKEECRQMDNHVGSGTIITAPIITDDGEPIKDPLVLMQAVPSANLLDDVGAAEGSDDETQIHITDKKIIQWKLTLHQIGLDVLRTDRTLVFYEKQSNLAKLWDILAVYAWIDKDVGYCQGMSDLCSPMIMLLQDEADAFWCFERLMRRLRGNFKCTDKSVGVENQLQSLASITQLLDPKLHQHLEKLGGGDYIFAFRMFMVLFRREFSFGDSLYLWEMMWALEYDPGIFLVYEEQMLSSERDGGSREKIKSIRQFGKYERENLRNGSKGSERPLPISVFLVASVLKEKSNKLLQEAKGLDDIVKILNDITGNLDAKKACSGAMKLHKKYLRKAKRA